MSVSVARPTPQRKARVRVIAAAGGLGLAAALCAVPDSTATAVVVANPVVQGTVLNDGALVAGATITPMVWPNEATIAKLAIGDSVPILWLPAVKSSANGNFAVSLDPSTLPAGYVNAEGRPNIELNIGSGTKAVTWEFQADQASGGGWTTTKAETDASNGEPTSPESVVVDLGSKPKVTEVEGATARSLASGGIAPAAAEDSSSADVDVTPVNPMIVPAGGACGVKLIQSTSNRAEPFAMVHAGATAAEWITENYGTTHTLGVAISVQGGPWAGGHAGGHYTVDLAASASKRLLGNNAAFNALNFNEYEQQCSSGGYELYWHPSTVYALLSRIDPAPEPPASFDVSCTIYGPGYTLTKYRGTNVTFDAQVNVIVASVDAQSGWNSSTEETWKTGGTKNYLCGNQSYGWVTSSQADMDSVT